MATMLVGDDAQGSGGDLFALTARREAQTPARIARDMESSVLLRAINGHLPETVRVVAVEPRPPAFHARFSAVGKRYLYRCLVSRVLPVFGRGRFHWIRRPVDLVAMRAGARHLIGEHDFAAFASNPGYTRKFGTVRRVHQLRVVRRPHGFDLFAQGNGFLYNMVRTIAGTLIEVGLGKRAPEDVARILASRDRRQAGFNAPAEGLYLLRVLYPDPARHSSESGRVGAVGNSLSDPKSSRGSARREPERSS